MSKIKGGLRGHVKKYTVQRFRSSEGKLCDSAVENAKALETHFEKVYNIQSDVDETVIDSLRQRTVRTDLDCVPTDEEISKALQKAKKNKATGDSQIPVEFWQALEGNAETEMLFKNCIRSFWLDEGTPSEWRVNRLKLIPKKGDLHDLNNWRGIMLMEAAPKLVSSIISSRIKNHILIEEGLEEQNGFMPHRGCRDGIFSLKLALQKRREHGQSTWAVFVDLVKAFDSVPRKALYRVLEKFGIPPKMKRIIVNLHSDLIVKIQSGDSDVEIASTGGVKQGCTMAPILFLIYMQAAIEVVNANTDHQRLQYKTREDHVFAGRPVRTRKDAVNFEVTSSLFADDGAFLYGSREELQKGMDLIFKTFRRLGLTCHVGRAGSKSKTEAMYFPPPRSSYEDANTLPLEVDGGLVTFTRAFKYLGSIISSNLDDSAEVDSRIKSASAAFASLRSQLFGCKNVKLAHKKGAYEGLVLGLLLYGSESWSLTQELRRRLQMFHNRCVRMMCRVTLWHMRQYHLHQEELESRLGLKPLDACLAQRRLRWAGHVYRMDFERLPRKLLSSWVDHPRPRGRPQFHFGHGLARDLTNAGVDVATWHQTAANRLAWLQLTQRPDICNLKKSQSPESQPPLVQPHQPQPLQQPPQLHLPSSPPSLPTTSPSPPTTSPSPPQVLPALSPLHRSPLLVTPTIALPRTPCSLPAFAHSPVLRCSRRLADKARQAGSRRVYSLKPIIYS